MPIPPRGLRDISTMSERGEKVIMPHKIYMQLSCLEMERARRMQERRSAEARMAVIDARMQEIDRLEEALLLSIGKGSAEGEAIVSTARLEKEKEEPLPGFILRY